jgi:hypothetical protein
MDSPLTSADMLPYLREAARLTGLQLDDDQLTRVAAQFVPSARMAAILLDFSLPAEPRSLAAAGPFDSYRP